MDYLESYYYHHLPRAGEGYDEERARHTAIGRVLPLLFKNELTERQAVCLQYRYVHGKKQSEIAAILGISQPSVSRHIQTARRIVNDRLRYCNAAVIAALEAYEQ